MGERIVGKDRERSFLHRRQLVRQSGRSVRRNLEALVILLLTERTEEMITAIIERCAGIHVEKKSLSVCVMVGPADGEARHELRTFGTTVAEFEAFAGMDWERALQSRRDRE
jgi:hypothetical protein